VIYHTNIRINGIHSDLMGVSIFFVISGFIMVHITRESADNFLQKRTIRIVPLYWIFTLATVAWFGFGFANPPYTYPLWAHLLMTNPADLVHWFANQASATLWTYDTAEALARSLFFWPTAQDPMPILGVGWTLNIEMFFYLLFALSLRINRTMAPLFAGVALTTLYFLDGSGLAQSKMLDTFGHWYVLFFVFGIAVYFVWRMLIPVIKRHRVAAIVVAFGALIYWPICSFTPLPFGALEYLAPPAVVLALLALHSADLKVSSRLLIDFGGASYALYLVHLPVLETLRATASAFPIFAPPTPIGTAIAVCISSLLAMLTYYKLEVPLLRYLHSRLRSRTLIAAPAPSPA
jgi:exopolysaccharide production protein ExoZ